MRGPEIRDIERERRMKLFEEIMQLVKEELGISDTVKRITNDIMSVILKDKKGKPLFKNKMSKQMKTIAIFQ